MFFLPTALIDLSQFKIGVFLLAVTVLVTSLGMSAIYSGHMKLVNKKVLIPAVLIILFTLLSAFLSTSYRGGFIGLGLEMDSWYMISALVFSVILIASVVDTKEKVFKSISLFWIGFGATSLFQLLRVLAVLFKLDKISNVLSLGGLFNASSINTIGTWADFGIVAGVSALSLAMTIDMVSIKKTAKRFFWGLFVLFALITAIASSITIGSGIDQLTNGSNLTIPFATIVGLIALIFAVIQLTHRYQEKESSTTRFPTANFVLVCIGVIFMISPVFINQYIYSKVGVPAESIVNVRPGFSDTYTVAKSTLGSSIKNSLIGVGPHGFYISWNQFKPNYVNNLDIWNKDYQFGVGYLPTILIENGIITFIAWLLFLIVILYFGVKSVLSQKESESSLYQVTVTFASALLLWINMLVNASGSAVIILTFMITGLLLSSLIIDKKISTSDYLFSGSRAKGVLSVLGTISIIVVSFCFAFIWVERTYSYYYSSEAMQMIYSDKATINTVPESLNLLQKAYNLYQSDVYAKGINNLSLVKINYDVSSDPENQNTQPGQPIHMSSSTAEYLNSAISSSYVGVMINPNDFRNYLQYGSTMQTAALLTGDATYGKQALNSFLTATNLAKTNPLPLYSLGTLYVLAGDKDSAKVALEQALKLKPNFTEASQLYQKLTSDSSTDKAVVPNASSTAIKGTKMINLKPTKSATSTTPIIKKVK